MLNYQNIGVYKYVKRLRATNYNISRDMVLNHLLSNEKCESDAILEWSYVIGKHENTWWINRDITKGYILSYLEIIKIYYEPLLIDLSNPNTDYPLIYIKDIIKTPIKTFLDYIPLLKYRVFFTSNVKLVKFIKENIDKL